MARDPAATTISRTEVIRRRNFRTALLRLLEGEYKILGSHRVLKILVDDICHLIDEYHLTQDRISPGELLFPAVPGGKSRIGRRAEEEGVVLVKLPLINDDDLKKASRSTGRSESNRLRTERMVRVIKAAAAQGGYLSIIDVATIFSLSFNNTAERLRCWQRERKEALPLAGFVKDKGSSSTHKDIVVSLYKEGVQPPEIARRISHSLEAVDRYLRDYERVKLLLEKKNNPTDIPRLIGKGKTTVDQYVKLLRKYHPELFPKKDKKG